jgi:hypothetical protein
MIKIATENFNAQVHPPVLLHYENDMPEGDDEYVDESFLEGDAHSMIDMIKKYIHVFSNPQSLKIKNNGRICGDCKQTQGKKHIFIIKHLDKPAHDHVMKGVLL